MDDVHDDHRLGDYRLTELLAEGPRTRTWLAEQISVRRSVLIERLMDDAPDARTSFLAGVRAQASVDHPQIGSVYEAVSDGQGCFSARERLPGRTLEERLLAGETLPSLQLAHALRRVAEANLYLEERPARSRNRSRASASSAGEKSGPPEKSGGFYIGTASCSARGLRQ